MVPRSYICNELSFQYEDGRQYGSACRDIVYSIVNSCPNLSLYSVVSNTIDTFDAYVKWSPLDSVILRIWNSNSTLYVYWVFLDTGVTYLGSTSNLTLNGQSNSNNVTVYRGTAQVTVTHIGDFLNTVAIYTHGYCVRVTFNWAYSVGLGQNLYMLYVTSPLGYAPTHSYVSFETSYSILGREGKERFRWGLHSSSLSGNYFPNSGSHYLVPQYNSGYNDYTYQNCGAILWGGLYDMYCLYVKGGTYVRTSADGYYIVNGETYRGCGTELYIPEPSIYLR